MPTDCCCTLWLSRESSHWHVQTWCLMCTGSSEGAEGLQTTSSSRVSQASVWADDQMLVRPIANHNLHAALKLTYLCQLISAACMYTGIQILIPGHCFAISCNCSCVQTSSCWDGQQRMRQCTVTRPGLWEDWWKMGSNCMLSYKSPILSLVFEMLM